MIGFGVLIAANLWLLLRSHVLALEMIVIWIPVLISALHAANSRRRTLERVAAKRQFADRLRFAHQWLLGNKVGSAESDSAALHSICLAAGEYSQRELRLALEARAGPPL
jgi:hypothetical protein